MKLEKLGAFVFAAVCALAVTACSAQQPAPAPEGAALQAGGAGSGAVSDPAAAEYPIVIQHAFGETVIDKRPERIAAIAWANQDTPLALGVVPVGHSMANFGPVDADGMHSWTAARMAELGEATPNVFRDTDGFDYEAISDARPDVILASYSGLTREEYELLSQIAPVVAYPREAWQTYWREQIVVNATGMGMQEAGERYVRDMESLIARTTAQYPQLEGKTGAFLWIDATDLSSFYLYFPIDTRAAYLTDLGIAFPAQLHALRTDDASFVESISAENIDVLHDLDLIVAYGDAALLETLRADPLFGTVPAIQRGSVVLIDSGTDLAGAATPSALSIPAILDEYVALLAEAADTV